MSETIEFHLPFGLEHNGSMCRKGTMHLATTLDELEIQTQDDVGMNTRYRDINLLSRVIDTIEGIGKVTVEHIENMFEADFLYLQILYKEVNGESEKNVQVRCPNCKNQSTVHIPSLYRDMSPYRNDAPGQRE